MAAAGALGVEGVNGTAAERPDRVFHEARLVERIGVDRYLHVQLVGHAQAAVDRGRRGTPVLVQLEPAGAADHLFAQRFRQRAVALAEESQVHGILLRRLEHAGDIPGARGAGGGQGTVSRPGAAAEHGGDAAGDRGGDQLRADEVDVAVDRPGGTDHPFAGECFGAGADYQRGVDAILQARIASLADTADHAVAHADVRLEDAARVDDQGVGNDQVGGTGGARGARILAHAVADHLAAAELDLVARNRQIALHLQYQLGVGQPHPIAGGGAEHAGVTDAAGREPGARPVVVGRRVALAVAVRCPVFIRHRGNPPSRTAASAAVRTVSSSSAPSTSPLRPWHTRSPPNAISVTKWRWPGSNRTAVPAGNGELHAVGAGAVEVQRAVHLKKVKMTAHLDRAVAGIRDR